MNTKPIVYQLVVRYFGNTCEANVTDGDLATNGCGKFADISDHALRELVKLGVTHVWLTGVLRQATLADYSAIGLPPDPADIVKGRAGSFFAVRDYCDVCPDYAIDPTNRMAEFEALVKRVHDAGLKAVIDLVPNHVSRNYGSGIAECNFGASDNQSRFFDPENNFFYLVDPSGQSLRLPRPDWMPTGVAFTGSFAREDGSPGHTPRATGNNVASPRPPVDSWYETVKLNWGFDFSTDVGQYNPLPRTWTMMDAVIAYWQSKGVDGFRCDFAHYVPAEAWSFLLGKARERDADAFFFAEAYAEGRSGEPVKDWRQLIAAGFDGIYYYKAYNCLKGIYHGTSGLDDYAAEMASVAERDRQHAVMYVGNHDEVRVAAPIAKDGFGSASAGYQLAPLQFLFGNGPVLLLNGDEVGENAPGKEGFNGDDGRTTMFDYWSMPVFRRWVNGHAYDGGRLTADEKRLRRFYADLLHLCQDDAVRGGGYWGLRDHNQPSRFGDCPRGLYTFARFRPFAGRLLLVVAAFEVGSVSSGKVRLTRQLADAAGLSQAAPYRIRVVLTEDGAQDQTAGFATRDQLCSDGIDLRVPEQRSVVFAIEPRTRTP